LPWALTERAGMSPTIIPTLPLGRTESQFRK